MRSRSQPGSRQRRALAPLDLLVDHLLDALDQARAGDPLRPALVVVPTRAATLSLRHALAEAAWRRERAGLAAVDVVAPTDVVDGLLSEDEERPLLSEPVAVALAHCALASLPDHHPLAGRADHPGTLAELVRSATALDHRAAGALAQLEAAGSTGHALADAIRALLAHLGSHWRSEEERWAAACATLEATGLDAFGEAALVVVEGAAPEPGEARLLRGLVGRGALRLTLPSLADVTGPVTLLECDDPETEVNVALAALDHVAPGVLDSGAPGLGGLGVPATRLYDWALPRALERLGVRWRGQDRRGHLGDVRWRRLLGDVATAEQRARAGAAAADGESLVGRLVGLHSWSEAARVLSQALEGPEGTGTVDDRTGTKGPDPDASLADDGLAWIEQLALAGAPFSLTGLRVALEAAARRPISHDDGPGSVLVVRPDQLEAAPLVGGVLLGCAEGVFPPALGEPLAVEALARRSPEASRFLLRDGTAAERSRIERRLCSVVAGLGSHRVVLSRPRAEWHRTRRLLPAGWLGSLSNGLDRRRVAPKHGRVPTIQELPVVVSPSPVPPEQILSVTGLVAYARCPRRFLVEHVLRLAPPAPPEPALFLDASAFGQVVHAALFELGRALWDLPPGELGPATVELLARRSVAAAEARLTRLGLDPGPAWTAQAQDCKRHVEHVLAETERRWTEEGWWVDGVELAWEAAWPAAEGEGHDVQAGNPALVVHGRIDRVDVGPSGRSVTDYKTGAGLKASALVRPVEKALDDGRFGDTCHPDALQLACYAEALRRGALLEGTDEEHEGPGRAHDVIEATIWATSEAGPAKPIPRAQLDARLLHQSVGLAAEGLRSGWFPPHPTTPGRSEPDAHCRGCPARGGLCPDDAGERWPSIDAVEGLDEWSRGHLAPLLDGDDLPEPWARRPST